MKARLSIVAALFAVAGLSPQTPTADVRFEKGLLSVRAAGVSLKALVGQIRDAAGVEVLGEEILDGTTTVSFERKAIDQAFDILLAGFDYIVGTRSATAGRPPGWQVRIVAKSGQSALHGSPATGPLILPALEAVRQAEEAMMDPEDPEEAEERQNHYLRMESDGAFLPSVAPRALLELLEDDDNPLVRRRLLHELNVRDPRSALKPLIEALADEDLTWEASDLLGRRADPESLTSLGEVLIKETDLSARVGALRAFALRADRASVKYMRAVEEDSNAIIRESAAQFIQQMTERAKPRQTDKSRF